MNLNYGALYDAANERTIAASTTTVDGPNKDAKFHLTHLPSDAVVIKENGKMVGALKTKADKMEANKTYVIHVNVAADEKETADGSGKIGEKVFETANVEIFRAADTTDTKIAQGDDLAAGDVIVVGATEIAAGQFTDADGNDFRFKEVNTGTNAFKAGHEYEIVSLNGVSGAVTTAGTNDASAIARAVTGIGNGDTLVAGQKFTVDASLSKAQLAHINSLSEGLTFRQTTDTLTKDIEAIQALVNTARVQAGSQYAAIESAVNYTTDLTAQYELGYNTVNDVNFSMETAHLAKNQILQQAATAMLAQANSGQQGLLQLIS